MNDLTIKQQKKVLISSEKDSQSVEIGDSVINQGFLKIIPVTALPIFLYLVTHLDREDYLFTNPTIISHYLSDDYNNKDIIAGLNDLTQLGFIETSPLRQGDYTYKIKINFLKIDKELHPDKEESVKESTSKELAICENDPAKENLQKILVSFIPNEINYQLALSKINRWLLNFEAPLLKELIRRVDKWRQKTTNHPQKAFYYLEGIIDDWYQKEIFDLEKLKHYDQLYRETRELAQAYGISDWQNVKPTHMEVFKSWLTDGFPLNISVAKLAIEEGIKRKKDGQPSLKYIEDNFIKPWKKAEIKNVKEARSYLYHQKNSKKAKKKKESWLNLYWDFEKEEAND